MEITDQSQINEFLILIQCPQGETGFPAMLTGNLMRKCMIGWVGIAKFCSNTVKETRLHYMVKVVCPELQP